jgi:hypothetical protein
VNDGELLDLVRQALESCDPPPPEIAAAGQAAYRWRTPPAAALAGLTRDRSTPMAGLRHGGAPRQLTFAGTGVLVEIEVTAHDRTREVTGLLRPAVAAGVRVRHAAGELAAETDPAGQFAVTGVPQGLVSLLFQLPGGQSVVTSWIRL